MLMFRFPRMTATVALGAAVVGGIAIAAPAQAAQIGEAVVQNNSSWGAGWDTCRREHPGTQSIRYNTTIYNANRTTYWVLWRCYDTTNAT